MRRARYPIPRPHDTAEGTPTRFPDKARLRQHLARGMSRVLAPGCFAS